MAKKTYRTFHLKGLDIHLHDEWGRPINAEFKGGIQIDSTAKFSTSDPKVQKALESCSAFNRDYYLESVKEEAPAVVNEAPAPKKEEKAPAVEKPVIENLKDIKRFHNLVEMRNYMAEIGFEDVQNMNYMQAKAAAAKEGYDFQIQR